MTSSTLWLIRSSVSTPVISLINVLQKLHILLGATGLNGATGVIGAAGVTGSLGLNDETGALRFSCITEQTGLLGPAGVYVLKWSYFSYWCCQAWMYVYHRIKPRMIAWCLILTWLIYYEALWMHSIFLLLLLGAADSHRTFYRSSWLWWCLWT